MNVTDTEPSVVDGMFTAVMTVLAVTIFIVVFILATGTPSHAANMAEQDDIAILTIAYEASSQSFEGQVAVASVIKTRMAKTGRTAEQVVLKPYQFSCWHPKTGQPTQKRKLSQKEIDAARKAWDAASPGVYNHYARHDCKPYWIKDSKMSRMIDEHVFYQL